MTQPGTLALPGERGEASPGPLDSDRSEAAGSPGRGAGAHNSSGPGQDLGPIAPTASTARPDDGRVRVRTLTRIRWGAVVGQAGAILFVHFGLGFAVPLGPTLAVVAASAMLNLVVVITVSPGVRLGERSASIMLAYDIVQLAVLLYLTGGLENPFSFLLLAPVTIAATVLGGRSIMALCALAIVAITILAVFHLPLPWGPGGLRLPLTYAMGIWASLLLGILFFASYTSRVADEARQMSAALAATQQALSREQQLSALGGLAAAAAHELGSPLGTIAVVTREMARDLPPDSPLAEDVQLLISETARCREILAELARRPDNDGGGDFNRMPIAALVELAANRHGSDRVDLVFEAGASDEGASEVPVIEPSPEIIHALGNLVQNAIQFARREVRVTTRWSERWVRITIRDDGVGFPPRLLEMLGEPYLSSRESDGDHMGLGIFIAQTLLQRSGAETYFDNWSGGGAEVLVVWPRENLEPPGRNQGAGAASTEISGEA